MGKIIIILLPAVIALLLFLSWGLGVNQRIRELEQNSKEHLEWHKGKAEINTGVIIYDANRDAWEGWPKDYTWRELDNDE